MTPSRFTTCPTCGAYGYIPPEPPTVEPSVTCPVCGKTSYNPTDIEMGYCGYCCGYTSPTRPRWSGVARP